MASAPPAAAAASGARPHAAHAGLPTAAAPAYFLRAAARASPTKSKAASFWDPRMPLEASVPAGGGQPEGGTAGRVKSAAQLREAERQPN